MTPLNRVVVKQELVELTGDFFCALILNQFLYWSQRVRDFDMFLEEEQARDPDKVLNVEATHGWIYKTRPELHKELMLGDTISVKTLGRKVKELEDMGYLASRRNPAAGWDRTMQYRPDINLIVKNLSALGYCLDGYPIYSGQNKDGEHNPPESFMGHRVPCKGHTDPCKGHGVPSKGQGDPSKGHGVPAIPETITETIPENTQKGACALSDFHSTISSIITHLNNMTLSEFRSDAPQTEILVKSLLNAGYTEGDFKAVIKVKCDQWMGDKEREGFLRPKTLFNPDHFESYLQEAKRQTNKTKKQESPEDRIDRMNYAAALYRGGKSCESQYNAYVAEHNFSEDEIQRITWAAKRAG